MDAATTSSRIAFGWFESHVEIWDVETAERISQFESVLSPGGRRLAISRDGNACFVAGWKAGKSGGVVAHDTSTGSILWHRRDIAETQHLISSTDGQTLWCSLDRGSALKLDVKSGSSATPAPAGNLLAEDRQCERRLGARRGRLYLDTTDAERLLALSPEMILSAVFTNQGVCVSKAGMATIFFNNNGDELWRFFPVPGSHITDLYCTNSDQLYAICTAYEDVPNLGSKTALLKIDQSNGNAMELAKISSPHGGAWLEDEAFVTSTGAVLRLSDGSIAKTLPLYPDT
jgi:outer membrane protein assembly factor BamB